MKTKDNSEGISKLSFHDWECDGKHQIFVQENVFGFEGFLGNWAVCIGSGNSYKDARQMAKRKLKRLLKNLEDRDGKRTNGSNTSGYRELVSVVEPECQDG